MIYTVSVRVCRVRVSICQSVIHARARAHTHTHTHTHTFIHTYTCMLSSRCRCGTPSRHSYADNSTAPTQTPPTHRHLWTSRAPRRAFHPTLETRLAALPDAARWDQGALQAAVLPAAGMSACPCGAASRLDTWMTAAISVTPVGGRASRFCGLPKSMPDGQHRCELIQTCSMQCTPCRRHTRLHTHLCDHFARTCVRAYCDTYSHDSTTHAYVRACMHTHLQRTQRTHQRRRQQLGDRAQDCRLSSFRQTRWGLP